MEKRGLTRPQIAVLGTVALMLILASISFMGSPISAETREDRGISIDIEREKGQDVLFVNESENYEVDIVGRFEAGGEIIRVEDADNWSLKTETDMDATIEPDDQDSNLTSEFEVDVTIHEEETGYLTFTAYCAKGENIRYSERQVEVKAVEAESVSVSLDNPTPYELEDVNVNLYVNGRLMNTRTIEELGPNESRDIEIKWSSYDLGAGEHELEIRTDYGFDGEEETLLTHTFYVEEDTSTALYGGIAAMAIGIGLVVFFLYRRKKKRRRRPW